MELKSCAITGHRPTRFKWKYDEKDARCKRLKREMQEQFILLYELGVRRFFIGGALGVDIWAGEILLQMQAQPKFSGIELIIVLPFEGYDAKWDDRSKNRIRFLIDHSTETVVAGKAAEPPAVCYKRRNYYMVDRADYLLAVYDNDRSIRSGTGMTVNYAQKKGLSITLIHPDTGVVSQNTDK
ncbi:SLOG family protein [uncultured Dysosmobacter sp.]|uniref:SLOG family protein n=1 Tax=uncultured Dysosmobacter sp. TaxID=2591384 RepID=UPI00260C4110|nr:SLOG family protein [uncultured Dysosmobacter sp.]